MDAAPGPDEAIGSPEPAEAAGSDESAEPSERDPAYRFDPASLANYYHFALGRTGCHVAKESRRPLAWLRVSDDKRRLKFERARRFDPDETYRRLDASAPAVLSRLTEDRDTAR